MKKFVLLIVVFTFYSCDFILKNNPTADSEVVILDSLRKNQILDDVNGNSCEVKYGYKWSNLQKKCVRVFEDCYRLTSIQKDSTGRYRNAYFSIDEDSINAEIYLPESKESIILKRENENDSFNNGAFTFKTKKRFELLYQNKLLFKSALAEDVKIIESDTEKMEGEPETVVKDSVE